MCNASFKNEVFLSKKSFSLLVVVLEDGYDIPSNKHYVNEVTLTGQAAGTFDKILKKIEIFQC